MTKNNNLFFQLTQEPLNKGNPFISIPNGKTFSYHEMISISAQYAKAAIELGIKKNDRVIVQTEKYLECIWLYLACLRIGAVYVPINPSYTLSETIFFIDDAKPSLFVSDKQKPTEELNIFLQKKNVKFVCLIGPNSTSLENIASKCDDNFETCFSNADSIAAILYTSGTTGQSKGAMLSHENLFSNAKALSEIWRFSASDILLHILPIYHTHGLFVAFNTALVANSSIIFLDKFKPLEVIRKMKGATVVMGVPTHYIRFIQEKNLTKESTSQIRLFISGSAPLSPEIHRIFFLRTGHEILERYGMTETSMITSNPYDSLRKPGTVGLPLPGVEIRVVATAGAIPVTDGIIGNIQVRGPNVFKGYWGITEKSKSPFTTDGYFITGDLGFIDTYGYLNISGRDKDLIISGGLNVYPAEVEQVIDSIEGILESAVIGLPHKDFGEGVTAIIVFEKQRPLDEPSLQNLIRQKIASFKVPLKIIVRKALPKNAMGKVQKKLLRNELSSIFLDK